MIDKEVINYPYFNDLYSLSDKVNTDFETDKEKVRAYYTWIVNNISYDINESSNITPTNIIVYNSNHEYNSIKRQQNLKNIKKTLESRKAICKGFCLLFVELCKLSNIKAEMVLGISKSSANEIGLHNNIKNHAWNTVKVDGNWELLDITWSSGVINSKTNLWEKKFNEYYFFTPPEQFLNSHYPEHSNWQLVDDKIDLQTFIETPIFYPKYFSSGITLSKNQKGEVKINDKEITISINKIKDSENIYYKFSHQKQTKKLYTVKTKDGIYTSTINCKNKTDSLLSLYLETEPIITFKVKK
ncbi:transglutaminase domain-containing protein [Jejuia spongiicola]|uniref:Transglutaminase-like domain-containing protein n=1 Tax=Jejuia spongiicola TaxID=2942207 RepID=A0ABT0QHU5_9FLAO|nr:transglutaminase domain-containing protein [Jejuia spongiicola]MCL6296556.1 hypothetical protein [Jejuia spongiicola]